MNPLEVLCTKISKEFLCERAKYMLAKNVLVSPIVACNLNF